MLGSFHLYALVTESERDTYAHRNKPIMSGPQGDMAIWVSSYMSGLNGCSEPVSPEF